MPKPSVLKVYNDNDEIATPAKLDGKSAPKGLVAGWQEVEKQGLVVGPVEKPKVLLNAFMKTPSRAAMNGVIDGAKNRLFNDSGEVPKSYVADIHGDIEGNIVKFSLDNEHDPAARNTIGQPPKFSGIPQNISCSANEEDVNTDQTWDDDYSFASPVAKTSAASVIDDTSGVNDNELLAAAAAQMEAHVKAQVDTEMSTLKAKMEAEYAEMKAAATAAQAEAAAAKAAIDEKHSQFASSIQAVQRHLEFAKQKQKSMETQLFECLSAITPATESTAVSIITSLGAQARDIELLDQRLSRMIAGEPAVSANFSMVERSAELAVRLTLLWKKANTATTKSESAENKSMINQTVAGLDRSAIQTVAGAVNGVLGQKEAQLRRARLELKRAEYVQRRQEGMLQSMTAKLNESSSTDLRYVSFTQQQQSMQAKAIAQQNMSMRNELIAARRSQMAAQQRSQMLLSHLQQNHSERVSASAATSTGVQRGKSFSRRIAASLPSFRRKNKGGGMTASTPMK